MTRYRLPEVLGGGEHEEYRHVDGGTEAPVGTVAFLVDGAIVCVAHVLLKPVLPPLPPEPPNFSTVRVGVRAYVRDDNLSRLSWVGPDGRRDWSELCRIAAEKTGFPPVLLVPAPEPVELPWEMTDREGYEMCVVPSQRPWAAARVGQLGNCADLTADDCRIMARALWTAADAKEATP